MKTFLRVLALFIVLALIPISALGEADARRAYEGTELNILLKTGYETSAITEFQQEFEDATGITLNIEIYDEATMRNKFILDCNTQQGNYDIVATQFWYMPEYINAGWLVALDDFDPALSDSSWNSLENIPESALGMFRGSDGKLYSICVSCTGGVLIYRTDLFEKYQNRDVKSKSLEQFTRVNHKK